MAYCSVAEGECLAPAGYLIGGLGGGWAPPSATTKTRCYVCGEPVCTAPSCSKRVTVTLFETRKKGRKRCCTRCIEDMNEPDAMEK